jgi:hypothetical protein
MFSKRNEAGETSKMQNTRAWPKPAESIGKSGVPG